MLLFKLREPAFGNRVIYFHLLRAAMQTRLLEHPDIKNSRLTDRVNLLTTSVWKKRLLPSSLSLCRLQTKFQPEKETSRFHVLPRVFVRTKRFHTRSRKHKRGCLLLLPCFECVWFYLWSWMKQQQHTPCPNCLPSLALLMTRAHTHAALRSTTAQRQV